MACVAKQNDAKTEMMAILSSIRSNRSWSSALAAAQQSDRGHLPAEVVSMSDCRPHREIGRDGDHVTSVGGVDLNQS